MATSLRGRRVRKLERDRGVRPQGEGEQLIALALYANSVSRADALRYFWEQERREATQLGRVADPEQPVKFMRLLDCTSWPIMIRQGKDHRRKTAFALDFRSWTATEIELWNRAADMGAPPPSNDEVPILAAMEPKLDALLAGAEKMWEQDAREMRLIVGGSDIGGGVPS
jgi:hypothetical protein